MSELLCFTYWCNIGYPSCLHNQNDKQQQATSEILWDDKKRTTTSQAHLEGYVQGESHPPRRFHRQAKLGHNPSSLPSPEMMANHGLPFLCIERNKAMREYISWLTSRNNNLAVTPFKNFPPHLWILSKSHPYYAQSERWREACQYWNHRIQWVGYYSLLLEGTWFCLQNNPKILHSDCKVMEQAK